MLRTAATSGDDHDGAAGLGEQNCHGRAHLSRANNQVGSFERADRQWGHLYSLVDRCSLL
jgi:hypothetical protein